MTTYREQMGKLADRYWYARGVENDETASTWMREQARHVREQVYKAMGNVEPDPLPEWASEAVAQIVKRLALCEVTSMGVSWGSLKIARGHWPFDLLNLEPPGPGWRWVDAWCDGLSAVWVNDDLNLILSYTEGDLTMLILDTPEHYQHELAVTGHFADRKKATGWGT